VALTGEKRVACRSFGGKPEEKSLPERSRSRLESNIKILILKT